MYILRFLFFLKDSAGAGHQKSDKKKDDKVKKKEKSKEKLKKDKSKPKKKVVFLI